MGWSFLTYAFWLGVPLILLLLFGFLRPKLAPLTLLICPLVVFLVFHQEFFYYESQGLLLLFTSVQMVLTAIPAFIIWARAKNKKEDTHDP